MDLEREMHRIAPRVRKVVFRLAILNPRVMQSSGFAKSQTKHTNTTTVRQDSRQSDGQEQDISRGQRSESETGDRTMEGRTPTPTSVPLRKRKVTEQIRCDQTARQCHRPRGHHRHQQTFRRLNVRARGLM